MVKAEHLKAEYQRDRTLVDLFQDMDDFMRTHVGSGRTGLMAMIQNSAVVELIGDWPNQS